MQKEHVQPSFRMDEEMRQARRSLMREQRSITVRKFLRNRLSVVGLAIVLVMLIAALFAPVICGAMGVDPYTATVSLRLKGPTAEHIFGTDNLGHDILSRLASGARFSLMLSVIVSALNFLIGTIYGAIEGYYGGKADMVMERIVDVLYSVPYMVLFSLLQLRWGKEIGVVGALLLAFVLTGWIGVASTVRTQFYRFKGQEYVLAARTLGASDARIIARSILPNSLGTIITACVLMVPSVIFTESSLSYLGVLNLDSSTLTSVGTMLSNGQTALSTYPHAIFFPALFISLMMISFNLFGNGLRDALNPTLRGAEE